MKNKTTERGGGRYVLPVMIAAMFAVTAFAVISFATANENNDDIVVGTPGTYNTGDIAFINSLIADKGLSWTPAPADGSAVPADWIDAGGSAGTRWSADATNKRVIELRLHSMGIAGALNVSALSTLTDLTVNDNYLTSVDVSGNTALTKLFAHNNGLTAIDVSNNTALRLLWVMNNDLTTINVSNNISLQDLGVSQNNLSVLNVSTLTDLMALFCDHNNLTSLDVSNNANLNELRCYFNLMESTNDVDVPPSFGPISWDTGNWKFSPQKKPIDITGKNVNDIETEINNAITNGFAPHVIGTNTDVTGTLTIDMLTGSFVMWDAVYGGSALVLEGYGWFEIWKDGSMTLSGLTADDVWIFVSGILTVNGDLKSAFASEDALNIYGGEVLVDGNVIFDGNGSMSSNYDGRLSVTGNVSGAYRVSSGDTGEVIIGGNVDGAYICTGGGSVTVNGNVVANGDYAIECYNDGIVHVKGNVSAPNGYAVCIYNEGIVKIDGTVTVEDDDEFIYDDDAGIFLGRGDTSATGVDGYHSKYTNGDWTVLIGKTAPPVKTVSVGTQTGTMTAGTAGNVTFTVTTANIPDGSYAVSVSNLPAGC